MTEDRRDALEEVRRQLFALCEDTQEQCHDLAQRDREGKPGAYARGRCYEAKSIARAMSDVFRELISSASLVEGEGSRDTPEPSSPPEDELSKLSGGWEPIETAPKDTAVLVYGFGYDIAHFNTALNRWVACWGHHPVRSTHWMPLPALPHDHAPVRGEDHG